MEPNKPQGQPKKPARPQAAKPAQAPRPGGQQPQRGTNRTPKGTRQGRRPSRPRVIIPENSATPVNKSIYSNGTKPQEKRLANQPTRHKKLRVIPLGGLGEIGKNMTAVEYENDIVIMDVGFAFPELNHPGVDYILPDTTYLEKNKHKVKGIIITHGHLDHIGAAGYMLPKFPVPVYGSRLSLAFVEKQIGEFNIAKPNFMVMDPDKHERVQIGAFNLELVRVTHTISDSCAIVLRTPVGTIINTGDWRHDPEPLDNKPMDMQRFKEIADEGVLLLMSDSTNCDRAGHNPSEQVVVPTIDDLFSRAKGRIIISAFSSSITRVQLVIDAAAKAKRKLALVGRSTLANAEICVRHGYIKIPPGLLMRVQDINTVKDHEVVVLSTGSQGEENSALVRMSTGDHQNIKIKPGDTIILSSSVIPGNEKAVVELIDNLMREGAMVYSRMTEGIKQHGPVHVGGHGFREDVGDLVKLIKPKYYMPIHGEFHHLIYSAEVAAESGVKPENIFVMDNGDVLEITEAGARKAERVPAGPVMVDGSGIGDVNNTVLLDRLAMRDEGMVVVVSTIDRKTGLLKTSPDIISRGFIYMKENEELVGRMRQEVKKAFEKRNPKEPFDRDKFKLKLRDELSNFVYAKTRRNPLIIPVINEL
jgi:ribonuclease J